MKQRPSEYGEEFCPNRMPERNADTESLELASSSFVQLTSVFEIDNVGPTVSWSLPFVPNGDQTRDQ